MKRHTVTSSPAHVTANVGRVSVIVPSVWRHVTQVRVTQEIVAEIAAAASGVRVRRGRHVVVVVVVVVVGGASNCAGGSPSINLAAVVNEEVADVELSALKIGKFWIEIKMENLTRKVCFRGMTSKLFLYYCIIQNDNFVMS